MTSSRQTTDRFWRVEVKPSHGIIRLIRALNHEFVVQLSFKLMLWVSCKATSVIYKIASKKRKPGIEIFSYLGKNNNSKQVIGNSKRTRIVKIAGLRQLTNSGWHWKISAFFCFVCLFLKVRQPRLGSIKISKVLWLEIRKISEKKRLFHCLQHSQFNSNWIIYMSKHTWCNMNTEKRIKNSSGSFKTGL